MNSHNTTKEIGYSVKSFETINTNPQSNFNFCNTYNSDINSSNIINETDNKNFSAFSSVNEYAVDDSNPCSIENFDIVNDEINTISTKYQTPVSTSILCSQSSNADSGYSSGLTEEFDYDFPTFSASISSLDFSTIELSDLQPDLQPLRKKWKRASFVEKLNNKTHPYNRSDRGSKKVSAIENAVENNASAIIRIGNDAFTDKLIKLRIVIENLTKYDFDKALQLFTFKAWGNKSMISNKKVTFQVQQNMFLYILRQGKLGKGQLKTTWRKFLELVPANEQVKNDLCMHTLCSNWRKCIAARGSNKHALLLAEATGVDMNYAFVVCNMFQAEIQQLQDIEFINPLKETSRFHEFLEHINQIEKQNSLIE